MPDEQGNFLPGGMTIKGTGGEILYGYRLVTELGKWNGDITGVTEDGKKTKIRMTVRDHDPDPFWIEHAPANELTLEMRFGSRTVSGPVQIIQREPRLVLAAVLENEDAGNDGA
jgi:hypothetical protein